MWQRIKNSLSGLQTLFESALSMCLCVYLSLYVWVCLICLCACVLCGFLRLVFLLFLIYANIDRVREAAKKYAMIFLLSECKSHTHTHICRHTQWATFDCVLPCREWSNNTCRAWPRLRFNLCLEIISVSLDYELFCVHSATHIHTHIHSRVDQIRLRQTDDWFCATQRGAASWGNLAPNWRWRWRRR